MRRPFVHLLLLSVVVMWGGAFVAIKILLRDASALTVTMLRFLVTSGAFLVLMAAWRPARPRIERGDRVRVAVLALTGVAGYHLALNFGERFVPAGVASLIVASMPVLVAIGSARYLHEQVTTRKKAGIGLAFAGVAVLALGGTPGGDLGLHSIGGSLIVVLAPVSWAVYTILSKPLVPKYGPVGLSAVSMVLGTIVLLPIALPTTIGDLGHLTAGDWGWVAFLALGCTVYGYVVWAFALGKLEASTTAAWVYPVPLVALGWAAILLHERVTGFVVLGGALVLAGVILTERGATRREPVPKEGPAPRERTRA